MSIGEVVLLSRLGEPLRVEVGLKLHRKEIVADSCLFLLPADNAAENDTDSYLPADLTAKLNESRHLIEISTSKPFNDLFAVFRLRIKCPGLASVTKMLILLPELSETPATEVIVVSTLVSAPIPTPATPQMLKPAPAAKKPALITKSTQDAKPSRKRAAKPLSANSEATAKPPGRFMLKLSGEPLDLSSIGKISTEERERLLVQQKLLDDDDQTARYLTMQNQLKMMHEELTMLKLKLSLLEVGAPSGVPAKLSTPSATAQNQTRLRILMVLGLLAMIVLTWMGLRQVKKARPRALLSDTPETPPPGEFHIQKPAEKEVTAVKPAVTPTVAPEKISKVADVIKVPIKHPEAPTKSLVNEEETMVLEEAELYSVYNHPDKAARILNEFIEQHPASEKAWMLLLSIYLSNGQAEEFEKAARSFLNHNKNSPSWRMFQALGRTLDSGNPLYIDEGDPASFAPLFPYLFQQKHRPIGEILIELGHLSRQDLTNCLKDFDSKKHGRFGVFLVKRRQITHAQLNEALLKQSGGDEISTPSDGMPTLQQIEELLKDFNPQRDGSVEEYLKSHKETVIEKFAHPASAEMSLSPETAQNAAPATAPNDPEHTLDAMLDFDWDMTAIAEHSGAENKPQMIEFETGVTPDQISVKP